MMNILLWPATAAVVWFGSLLGFGAAPPAAPPRAVAIAPATDDTADDTARAIALLHKIAAEPRATERVEEIWLALESLQLNPFLTGLARAKHLDVKAYNYVVGGFILFGALALSHLPREQLDQVGDSYPLAYASIVVLLFAFRNDYPANRIPMLGAIFFLGAMVGAILA